MSATPPPTDDNDGPFSELAPLAPSLHRPNTPLTFSARLWSWAVSAVPIVILTALAGISWWLVQNAPEASGPSPHRPPSHDPDLEMRRFSMREFDATGIQRSMIEGAHLKHFPDSRQTWIDQARMSWDDQQGVPHKAQAQQALGDDTTHDVQLIGSAQVWRDAPDGQTTFHSQHLWISATHQEVLSPHAVHIQQANGSDMRADRFHYTQNTGMVSMEGHVRGTLIRAPATTTRRPTTPRKAAPLPRTAPLH